MDSLRRFGAAIAVILAVAVSLPATLRAEKNDINERPPSQWAWANETPEERQIRIGSTEDPGLNPDPEKVFIRFGQEYTIERFEKKWAAFDQVAGWVRPLGHVNIEREIYREDEKYVWVWHLKSGTAQHRAEVDFAQQKLDVDPALVKEMNELLAEFSEISVPPANVVLSFVESTEGLPQEGSWRNIAAVADMNNDGHLDIIAPPQRGLASARLSIFLGDGAGKWTRWSDVVAPGTSYGSVAVGDLNKDGIPDIVLGVHLRGITALLGDGKGGFTSSSEGLPRDFPTRRAIIVDIDRDGDLDIVALSEVATPGGMIEGSRLRAYLNDGKATKWTQLDMTHPHRQLGGDWLAVGDFNADKRPDFVAGSVVFNGTDLIQLSKGKKNEWESFGRGFLPFYSIYTDVDAARFTSSRGDDAILAFRRSWASEGGAAASITPPPFEMIAGIEMVSWQKGKAVRKPIVRWFGAEAVFGMATGDFNGDKKPDILYTTWDPREFVILLGDGKGNFTRATVEGVKPPQNTNYEITVADINRDGRDDFVVLYEAKEKTKDGSIRAYLSAPPAVK